MSQLVYIKLTLHKNWLGHIERLTFSKELKKGMKIHFICASPGNMKSRIIDEGFDITYSWCNIQIFK